MKKSARVYQTDIRPMHGASHDSPLAMQKNMIPRRNGVILGISAGLAENPSSGLTSLLRVEIRAGRSHAILGDGEGVP